MFFCDQYVIMNHHKFRIVSLEFLFKYYYTLRTYRAAVVIILAVVVVILRFKQMERRRKKILSSYAITKIEINIKLITQITHSFHLNPLNVLTQNVGISVWSIEFSMNMSYLSEKINASS